MGSSLRAIAGEALDSLSEAELADCFVTIEAGLKALRRGWSECEGRLSLRSSGEELKLECEGRAADICVFRLPAGLHFGIAASENPAQSSQEK